MIKLGKRGQEEEKIFLADGMILKLNDSGQEENRVYTLLLKGILVYLIVMGGMGCFLSSLQVEYASWVLHIVILFTAVFCSMLYYHKMWENIGYIMLLVLLLVSGNGLSIYINSGFYAVANDMAEKISDFFGRNVMRNYGEQVGNRYLAVTISMCFIGCICCILMNVLISRRMRYFMAILVGVGMLLMPMYLELEPDGLYIAMFLGGLLSAYIVRCGGHYQLRQGNAKYEFQNSVFKKKTISYVYAGRTLAAGLAAVFLICFFTVSLVSVIYPKEQFQSAHMPSGLKKRTMDTVENVSLSGLMGLFNFYPNTGGLTSGTLGGISSVRLDFETDLRVEFAPYSGERLYLKYFTGEIYLPYSNRWSRLADEYWFEINDDDTALRMREQYEAGREYTARGIMKITNVAAAVGAYLPYYSEDTNIQIYPGQTREYIFYPRLSREPLAETEETWMGEWLVVPDENWDTIAAFCEEAGLSEENMSTAQIVSGLTQYYQDNIPYTLRPGLTPYNADFVNYFLEENRRGYCAHFASAATLIFRYLGIPARYVEGYAIDPTDIFGEGTRLEEARYEEYYEGYSPLGVEAVVSVDATDANAHAWVEIYDEALGWQVVEVTPASDEEEETGESLWQRLLDFLGGNQDGAAEQASDEGGQTGIALDEETRQLLGRVLCLLAGLFAALFAGRRIVFRLLRDYRYRKADRNEKLIMRYQEYIRKISRKKRELTRKVNYQEQLGWLLDQGFWEADEKELSECIRILEQAGFSQTEIDEAEFAQVIRHLAKSVY
ncbi:MAG: transglutaminase-like domain-containing protein [Lachnospiraceae bacterium]|nr:transglutaminase-like domain-containing protein [Lachnospiraceae bacterium]